MGYRVDGGAEKPEDGKETQKLVPAGGYCHPLYEGSGDVEFRKYGRMFGLCLTVEET